MAGLLLVAGAARGAEPAASVEALVVTAPKTIAELLVTANIKCVAPDRLGNPGTRPKVVSSFPARDAVVRPGLIVMRVTFDKPMACAGRLAGLSPWPSPCPGGTQSMLLSFDRRTVRTACAAAADSHYGVSLNRDLDGDAFLGVAGLPAESRAFGFTTSSGPAVGSVCEALAEDAWTVRQLARAHRTLACPPPGG
ncbi:hypothetical protein [Phenylobacterium sp.]|uniref:hypothetical protein n=1 Tax=Phenylobacterium sp. TaxID=1871053 RepID=UPI00374CF3EB